MKKYLIPSIIMAAGLFLVTFGIVNNKRPEKQPVYVEYFKAGQVLEPDMVCQDTLIVVNADGLNKGFALMEQGYTDFDDYSIDSLLHMNCRIK